MTLKGLFSSLGFLGLLAFQILDPQDDHPTDLLPFSGGSAWTIFVYDLHALGTNAGDAFDEIDDVAGPCARGTGRWVLFDTGGLVPWQSFGSPFD